MAFWDPRPVEGTEWDVRAMPASRLFEIKDEIDSLGELDQIASVLADSVVKHGTTDPVYTAHEWKKQPYPLLKHLEHLALEVNGLVGSPLEAAEGN